MKVPIVGFKDALGKVAGASFPVVAVYGLSGCIRIRKPSIEPIHRLARVFGARTVHDQDGQRRCPAPMQ